MISLAIALAMSDIAAAEYFPMFRGQTEKSRALVQPYFDCAFGAAGELEKSGDAASEVARAAITFCEDARIDLEATIVVKLMAAQTPDSSERVMSKFDEWMLNHLQMRIVAKRALQKGNLQ